MLFLMNASNSTFANTDAYKWWITTFTFAYLFSKIAMAIKNTEKLNWYVFFHNFKGHVSVLVNVFLSLAHNRKRVHILHFVLACTFAIPYLVVGLSGRSSVIVFSMGPSSAWLPTPMTVFTPSWTRLRPLGTNFFLKMLLICTAAAIQRNVCLIVITAQLILPRALTSSTVLRLVMQLNLNFLIVHMALLPCLHFTLSWTRWRPIYHLLMYLN